MQTICFAPAFFSLPSGNKHSTDKDLVPCADPVLTPIPDLSGKPPDLPFSREETWPAKPHIQPSGPTSSALSKYSDDFFKSPPIIDGSHSVISCQCGIGMASSPQRDRWPSCGRSFFCFLLAIRKLRIFSTGFMHSEKYAPSDAYQ